MGVRDRFLTGLAAHLAARGLRGRFVARGLNRANRTAVTAAVDATELKPGQVVAASASAAVSGWVLLDRVRPGGHVHGIDLSDTMLERAGAALRTEGLNGAHAAARLDHGAAAERCIAGRRDHRGDHLLRHRSRPCVHRAGTGAAPVGACGDRARRSRRDGEQPVTAHGFTLRPVDEVLATLTRSGFAPEENLRIGAGDDAFHVLVARKDAA